MLFLLFSYLFFIGILQIKFLRNTNHFESAALLLVVLVSVYAVIKTNFHTIYVLGMVGACLYTIKSRFELIIPTRRDILINSLIALFCWALFFFLYVDFDSGFLTPGHEDYIIYSRMAKYNDELGVENTKIFYNLFEQGKIESYHFFEMWLASMGNRLNGQGYLSNLYLFSFPLLAYLSCLGIQKVIGDKSKHFASLVILALAIAVCSPYDFLFRELLQFELPESGVGLVFLYLKHLAVFPITLYVISTMQNGQTNYVFLSVMVLFYPLIAPVLFPSLLMFTLVKSGFKPSSQFFYLLAAAMVFGLFFILAGSGEPMIDLDQLLNVRLVARVIFVGVLLPGLVFGWTYLTYIRDQNRDLILLLAFMLLTGNALWLILSVNINANQFYSIPFNSMVVLCTALSIYSLVIRRKWVLVAVCLLLFILPSAWIYSHNQFLTIPANEIQHLKVIPQGERVLYAPMPEQITSIFQYNERMSLPDNDIFIGREDLHLINTVTCYTPTFSLDNKIRNSMVNYYRKISPYYQKCGSSQDPLACMNEFCATNKINYLLMHPGNLPDNRFWNSVGKYKSLEIFKYNSGTN